MGEPTTDFYPIEKVCVQCGDEFTWTANEQTFLTDLQIKGKLDRVDEHGNVIAGIVQHPKRCKECRLKQKDKRNQTK